MTETAYQKRFRKQYGLKDNMEPIEIVELRGWLCRELGERLIIMAKASCGHPMVEPYAPKNWDWDDELPKGAFKQWKKDLKTAGKALVAYSKSDDLTLDEEVIAMKEAQSALTWVSTYLPNLWV